MVSDFDTQRLQHVSMQLTCLALAPKDESLILTHPCSLSRLWSRRSSTWSSNSRQQPPSRRDRTICNTCESACCAGQARGKPNHILTQSDNSTLEQVDSKLRDHLVSHRRRESESIMGDDGNKTRYCSHLMAYGVAVTKMSYHGGWSRMFDERPVLSTNLTLTDLQLELKLTFEYDLLQPREP